MKTTVINGLLLLGVATACLGEKPIRGRPFSRPLFSRQEEAPTAPAADAPYPPSGWKPQGQRLTLPARQEAGVPHTVYGPPSSEAPPSDYGPPEATDLPQYPPNNAYGPPEEQPQVPDSAYGAPNQEQPEPLEPQQPERYPPGEGSELGAPNGGYDYPPPEDPFPAPTNAYGPPASAPGNAYGPPISQPNNEDGSPQEPDDGYGAPPRENGQLPVDQSASERLRQQQFIQRPPGFAPSRFVKPRPQRLRQQALPHQQHLSQRNQPNRGFENKQPFRQQRAQQARAQTQQFVQKQQLYQTPRTPQAAVRTRNAPNVASAISTISGEYYVVEPNGRLQRVSYTTMNGKLIGGKITSGIKPEDIRNTKSPIYQINAFNQLVKINSGSSK